MQTKDLSLQAYPETYYGTWVATGKAFRHGPATRKLYGRLEIQHAVTGRAISSEVEGDEPTGTLMSPEFTIARDTIAFRIGGGNYPGRTCLNLMVDGKVVRTATGFRSDYLAPLHWEVRNLRGKRARLVAVDQESGDWGHINIDGIIQTDHPEKTMSEQPLYQEDLRPQFHFTARYWNDKRLNPVEHQEGWINDLNGLIYYEGEYHLFAQRWATCWLHAVSKDLVHWTELEPAFWEESEGSGVQSGTCVIDYQNTSGLSPDPRTPPMIAFWSRFDNRSQCLCYSLDRGRTWKRYARNPFMVKPERDPKVFWYAPGNHWVMVMYGDGAYHILTSTNLLDWTDTNHPIPDSFECPDMFEMAVDGDARRKKWVLIQGSGQYSVGTFDGKAFQEETPRLACDIGPNFYATQTWANTETGDGRRIQTAWMRGSKFPNMPFSQQISFPCELTLRQTHEGVRLYRQPITEIEKLHAGSHRWQHLQLTPGSAMDLAKDGYLFRIRAQVRIPEGAQLTFHLRGEVVTLGPHTLESGQAKTVLAEPVETVEILLDRGSVEVFVNHGAISSTRFILPDGVGLSVAAKGGSVDMESTEVNPLKSIWPE